MASEGEGYARRAAPIWGVWKRTGTGRDRGREPSRGLIALSVALSLESLAVFGLIGTQADVRSRLQGLVGRGQPAAVDAAPYESRLDPPVGRPAPAWRALTTAGKTIGGRAFLGRPVAMLFIGACGKCVLGRVQQWAGLARRSTGAALLVVTPDTRGNAADLSAEVGPAVRVVCDPAQQMALAYNAAWRPRAYLVGRRGTLRYVQGDRDTTDAATTRVVQLLQAYGEQEAGK